MADSAPGREHQTTRDEITHLGFFALSTERKSASCHTRTGIFAKFKKENSIRNQYEFMIQRCQGPPLYSQVRRCWRSLAGLIAAALQCSGAMAFQQQPCLMSGEHRNCLGL